MSKEAMKLALEAINNLITSSHATDPQHWRDARQDAVTALAAIDKALAEQPAPVQQEPVAWLKVVETHGGWGKFVEAKPNDKDAKPVYTTPPQRKPLTDEEIEDLYFDKFSMGELKAFARAIEAAHGIKGDA